MPVLVHILIKYFCMPIIFCLISTYISVYTSLYIHLCIFNSVYSSLYTHLCIFISVYLSCRYTTHLAALYIVHPNWWFKVIAHSLYYIVLYGRIEAKYFLNGRATLYCATPLFRTPDLQKSPPPPPPPNTSLI